jgi:hypothetical protein
MNKTLKWTICMSVLTILSYLITQNSIITADPVAPVTSGGNITKLMDEFKTTWADMPESQRTTYIENLCKKHTEDACAVEIDFGKLMTIYSSDQDKYAPLIKKNIRTISIIEGPISNNVVLGCVSNTDLAGSSANLQRTPSYNLGFADHLATIRSHWASHKMRTGMTNRRAAATDKFNFTFSSDEYQKGWDYLSSEEETK